MGLDFAVDHPDLSDVVAVVTGSGRGLGREFALELARSGASVGLTGRAADGLEETARLIGELGGRSTTCVADVTDRAAVEDAAARIEAKLGVPGLLVNNAGQIDVAPFSDADPATWWRVVEVNLRGTFNWTQGIVGRMLASNRGRVLNITSPAAKSGPPTTTSYNVSKAAISSLTSTLAAELPSISRVRARAVRLDRHDPLLDGQRRTGRQPCQAAAPHVRCAT